MDRRNFLALSALVAVDYEEVFGKIIDEEYSNSGLDKLLRANENSEPYLDCVLQATKKHSNIYKLPPIFPAFLFRFESRYDPLAFSSVGAFGIAQFMPKTAKVEGMQSIPETYPIYAEMMTAYKLYIKTRRGAKKQFDKNNFDKAISMKKKVPELRLDYNEKFKSTRDHFRELFEDKTLDQVNKIDERANPFLSIDTGVGYLAKLARAVKHDTGLDDAYVLLMAAAAYNAGLNATLNTFRGIPLYDETMRYVNRLMMSYGKFCK